MRIPAKRPGVLVIDAPVPQPRPDRMPARRQVTAAVAAQVRRRVRRLGVVGATRNAERALDRQRAIGLELDASLARITARTQQP
jgi:hypothetical protein